MWATLWQAVTCTGQSPVPHGDTLNYQSTDQTSRAPLLVPVLYITDMNLLKFTHIIIHHTDPHTLNRNHILSSDCDRWSGFPAPTRVYFKDLKIFIVFQGFIKLFDRKISWLWGLRVSCDFVFVAFVCQICELTADRWRNVVAKVTLWVLMSQIWGVSV